MKCPRCSNENYWRLGDGRFKCSKCRKTFTDQRKRVGISRPTLRRVVREFLLEHSTNVILERVDISRYMLLLIFSILRIVMIQDVPKVFERDVKVDEAYLAGKKWYKWQMNGSRVSRSNRGKGSVKQAVFGIRCKNGKVWAELIEGLEARDVRPEFLNRTRKHSTFSPHTWPFFTAMATIEHCCTFSYGLRDKLVTSTRNQVQTLRDFWRYLKRKFAAKGGIRKGRLHLHLGEYVWRYNNRNLDLEKQERRLMILLSRYIRSG